jgi:hypothetical protein
MNSGIGVPKAPGGAFFAFAIPYKALWRENRKKAHTGACYPTNPLAYHLSNLFSSFPLCSSITLFFPLSFPHSLTILY